MKLKYIVGILFVSVPVVLFQNCSQSGLKFNNLNTAQAADKPSTQIVATAVTDVQALCGATATDRLVEISNLELVTVSGCGQQPPDGKDCSNIAATTISFMVPSGGSCHQYSAKVFKAKNKSFLCIYDTEQIKCTRPEMNNFETSIVLEGRPDQPLLIANSLYIQERFAE